MPERLTADRWARDLSGEPRNQWVEDVVDTAVFAVAVLLLVLIAIL
jgi:hypothetical protein